MRIGVNYYLGWVVLLWLAIGSVAHGEAMDDALLAGDLVTLYGDEEFVSIATGSKKPVYKAPAVATVITAEEIEAMGARNLDEVLETVPGLHVSLSSLSRLDSIYSIRGIHTGFNPQVLVLMNGTSYPNTFTGGRPFLFRLPVSGIERIEIIRGPGSAIYGADAFSGVINIITKKASDIPGTVVGARAGSFDTQDFWLQHGKTWLDWNVAFSFEYQHSNGDDDRRIDADLQTSLDKAFNTNASLAPGTLETRYQVFDTHLELERKNWLMRLWHWRLEDAGLGAGGFQALDSEGRQDIDQYMVDLSYQTNELHPDWELNTTISYLYRDTQTEFVLLPPGTIIPIGEDGNIDVVSPNGTVYFPDGLLGNPDGKEYQGGLGFTGTYLGQPNHRLRMEGGIKYLKLDTSESKNFGPGVIDGSNSPIDGTVSEVSDSPYVYAPDKSRTLWYLSVQDEWQVAPDWELTAGIRYDHYSDFGNTVNPRLALVWAVKHNLSAKFLYGRAFRPPSFSELYAINNPVALGNPDLDPETIDTIELSFDYRPTFDLVFNFSLFGYQAEDLIEFVPDQNTTSQIARNARDQQGYGFELEMDWSPLDTLTFKSNYSWQHSEDQETGIRIADAPRKKFYLSAEWNVLRKILIMPQVFWIGDRERAPGDPRDDIDNYTLVNVTIRTKKLLEHWELAVSGHNIFNENAREPSSGTITPDYPLEGRSLWAEASYRF